MADAARVEQSGDQHRRDLHRHCVREPHFERRPAKRALAALDKTEPDVDTRVRQRRISKKVNAAIDLLVSGDVKTIKEAFWA